MNEWGAPNGNLPVKGSRLSIRERICYSCGSFRGLKAKLTAEERLKQIVDTELNCKTIRSRQIQGQEQSSSWLPQWATDFGCLITVPERDVGTGRQKTGGKPERRIEQNTVSASFCYYPRPR
jgi:hypothetical protein